MPGMSVIGTPASASTLCNAAICGDISTVSLTVWIRNAKRYAPSTSV
jgi:hypothetical protein